MTPRDMVIVGKHLTCFACCGLVVEIQPLSCYFFPMFAPLPTSTKERRFQLPVLKPGVGGFSPESSCGGGDLHPQRGLPAGALRHPVGAPAGAMGRLRHLVAGRKVGGEEEEVAGLPVPSLVFFFGVGVLHG